MAPEQDRAMMAVLKAIAEARRTGVTEQQISDRIERTKPDKAIEGASSAPAGDDAGWNPLTEEFPDADASDEKRLHQKSESIPSQLLSMNVNLSVYGFEGPPQTFVCGGPKVPRSTAATKEFVGALLAGILADA